MSSVKTGLMYSPFSESIYWGKFNQKTGVAVGNNKKDVTSDFIGIMMQKFPKGTRQNITINGEVEAVVIVVEEDIADRFSRSKSVEAQRDELLEALKEFVNNSSIQVGFPSLCEEAERVITKAEGGE